MKRNWILSGAVAAMLASASSVALAQDATPAPPPMAMPAPPPPAPTPDAPPAPMAPPMDTTAPMSNPGSLSSGMSAPMAPGAIDYSVLGDPDLNYSDLKKAKADGFSDNEVASIAKLSHYSGVPFQAVVDRVLHGTTFSTLSTEYGVKLPDVLNVADEKDKIAAYETAYEATGTMALKNSSMGMTPVASVPMPMTPATSTPMAPTKDIVAIAMSDKRFSTLVKELKKADLVSALQGPGPFTVFAPTNAAFKKLPKGALKELEKDPTKLAAVLKYHVLPARVDAATATSMTSPTSPPTLEGSTLQVTSGNGSVKINDATVVQADIMATNGIIHAIDTVLMPTDLPAAASMDTTPAAPMATPNTDSTGAAAPTPPVPGAPTPDAATTAPATTPDAGTTAPATTPDAGTAAPMTMPAPAPTTPAQ